MQAVHEQFTSLLIIHVLHMKIYNLFTLRKCVQIFKAAKHMQNTFAYGGNLTLTNNNFGKKKSKMEPK